MGTHFGHHFKQYDNKPLSQNTLFYVFRELEEGRQPKCLVGCIQMI